MNIEASASKRRFAWLLLGLLVGSLGCRKRAASESEAELARARCASACAGISSCERVESALDRQARCLEICATLRAESARAGCVPAQDRALRCASSTRVACEKPFSPREALERGAGLAGCQAEFAELASCTAPCREAGVVRSAARSLTAGNEALDVKAELVSLGCGPQSGELGRKSPPGSPCEHFSVCTPVRCPCPGSNAAFTGRACVDGRCATGERACELSPRAVGFDACKGR